MVRWRPMARRASLAMMLVFVSAAACKRGAPAGGQAVDAGSPVESARVGMVGATDGGTDGAIFSLPIAGARVPGSDASGGVVAVGLVVVNRSITAQRIDSDGKVVWTRAAIPDVSWSADAELHAWPVAAGEAIVWRGPVGKKSGHVAVVLGADGRVIDGPIEVGSFVCATDDGLAWSDGAANGATRVRLRTYASGGASHDDTGPALMADFSLTCGAHRAFALSEGDESTPTKVYRIGGEAGPLEPLATITALTLGRDEERDLFPWVDGDEIGLVRVAQGGEVQAATLHDGAASLIHADRARVVPEDDVVGIDADARQVVVVTTHDESDACPNGRGGSSVNALKIPRAGGSATSLRLAPAGCGKDVGPFWTNSFGRSVVVAWPERSSRPAKTSAPVTGLAYRTLEEGGATGRIALLADAIADAGCDERRCYAVALVRKPGDDGSKPEATSVLAYP